VIFLIIFFFLFLIKSFSLDPDLGWHLVTGQYILLHGFPKTDPFSYTMPSYPIVPYEWGTDLLLVAVYNLLGLPGLTILFAGIAIASLWLLTPTSKKLLTIPLLLSGSTLLFVVGVRPQVVSWLLFSLLLLTLNSKRRLIQFFIPLIFLLWANLHGSFVLGLGVLALYIISNVLKRKKSSLLELGIGFASVIATLINPYGIHLWQEMIRILFWPEKHTLLLDWFPGIFVPYIPLWIFIALSVFFLIKYRSKYALVEKIVFTAILCVGLTAIIDIPYFILFSTPLLVRGITQYHAEKSAQEKRPFVLRKSFVAIIVISIVIHSLLLLHEEAYPSDAVAYLQKNPPQGQVFTYFNWAGYVIWQLPQKKVFVDGEMPHWNQPHAQPNESANAFQEYLAVMSGRKSIGTTLAKYNIDTVLLPTDSYAKVIDQLKKNKWKIVYKDRSAVIYQKANLQK
jgi:hypothetical protein